MQKVQFRACWCSLVAFLVEASCLATHLPPSQTISAYLVACVCSICLNKDMLPLTSACMHACSSSKAGCSATWMECSRAWAACEGECLACGAWAKCLAWVAWAACNADPSTPKSSCRVLLKTYTPVRVAHSSYRKLLFGVAAGCGCRLLQQL
jgi:hypothetical protein